MMSTKDKANNTAQDVKGQVQEAAGRIANDKDLEDKGKSEQVKAAVKGVGEDLKDLAEDVKAAAEKAKDAALPS